MRYEQYHHMPQQMASGVLQAPIGPAQCHPAGFNTGISGGGPGVETSGAHAPEGTEPSSREQGDDRVQTRSPARSNRRSRGNKRPRCEWSDPENEFLITCKQASLGNGGRPSKGNANRTDWEEISARFREEFADRGEVKSSDQIRQKWDTFLKSHKIIKKLLGQKDYSQLADKDFDDDIRDLKLAIKLKRKWYMIIDQCQVSSQQPNIQTSSSLDSRMYVVPHQCSPTERQAYNQPPALQSASPGIGRNSPTHSQTTHDYPPFGSSGDACVEITPDNNHREAESGAAPAIVMRQSEGQSAPTTIMPWIDDVQATNRADIQNQAPPTQNEGNNIDHPRLQNSSPDTAYNPLTHSEANHYRPPIGHSADTGVHFRSGDGHTQAENIQIGRGGTLQVMTEDRGQSDQLPIAAPSIDIAPTESTGIQDEAQELGGRRPLKQVAIPYFNSLSETTKSVLLDLIVCDIPDNLRDVCQWLASLHDEDPINIMASVQELALHGLLDIQPKVGIGTPLQWGSSGMWEVKLKKEKKTHQKFVLNVIRKYPKHRIHLHIWHDGHQDLQRSLQRRLSEGLELFTRRRGGGLIFGTSLQHQQLKELCLDQCTRLLREVDLRNFPNLRSFTMQKCPRASVTGWKYVTKLEWLKLEGCGKASPGIEHLSSLKYLHLCAGDDYGGRSCELPILDADWVKSSEGCQLQTVGLSRYAIADIKHLANLKNLQSLILCDSYISEEGLQTISVLHSLIELSFSGCYFLDYSVDSLDLSGLRHLSSLDISRTGDFCTVMHVEKLENLTYLHCEDSELEYLPDLSHLKKLRWVNLKGTLFLAKLESGDLQSIPEWLSRVQEETVVTESEWNDSTTVLLLMFSIVKVKVTVKVRVTERIDSCTGLLSYCNVYERLFLKLR